MDKMYEEDARKAITSSSDEFDKDFFKDLASRYYELEKTFWNIQVVYVVIAAFLASRLLGGAEISLFGLSIKSPTSLREPLLFALAILGIITTLQLQQLDKMRYLLKLYSLTRYPGNPRLYAIKFAHFIPGDLHIPDSPKHMTLSGFGKFVLIIFVVSFVAIYFAVVVASGLVGLINAYDIYQNPSEYKYLSYVTVFLYVLSWFFGAVFMAMNKLPFAYKDYTDVHRLSELRSSNEEEHDRALKKLSHLAFLKAGLKSPHEDIFKDASGS
jgi:CBS domain-containing protein